MAEKDGCWGRNERHGGKHVCSGIAFRIEMYM